MAQYGAVLVDSNTPFLNGVILNTRFFCHCCWEIQRYKPGRAAQLLESISRALAQQMTLCLGDTVQIQIILSIFSVNTSLLRYSKFLVFAVFCLISKPILVVFLALFWVTLSIFSRGTLRGVSSAG